MNITEIKPEVRTNESFPDISLREVAAPLFRRRRVLIGTFLTVFLLVVIVGSLMAPQFTSKMAVLVNRERLDPVVTTQATTPLLTSENPVTEDEINSEAELLKSRDVLEKVVRANGLENTKTHSFLGWFRPRQTEADRVARAVRTLAKRIKVSPITKTNLIGITYSSPDPMHSYKVLESLSNFYMDKHVAVHRPPGSYQFFAQEAQRYQDALKDSEDRLKNFGQQPGAAAPDLERTNLAVQVTNAIGQSHQAQEAIASDEQRIASDRRQMQSTPHRLPTLQSTHPADRLLEDLQNTLLTARLKRGQLAMKYDASYPLVQEADQEIASAQAAITKAEKTEYVTRTTDQDPTYELLREDVAKTESDLAAQRANLAAIRSSVQSLQTQMSNLDQQALTQQDLQRNVKTNEDNYLLYLSKREQERTSDALDKTRIENVAIAIPPDIPALPTHGFLFTVAVALGLALVLAIIAAYLVEYFDPSFHTPAQVSDILGIPVVVAIPKKTA